MDIHLRWSDKSTEKLLGKMTVLNLSKYKINQIIPKTKKKNKTSKKKNTKSFDLQ